MWWQENAWEKFALQNHLAIPASLADLAPVFRGQQPLPEPVTRQEFLANPSSVILNPNAVIPAEWITEAWHSNTQFRENLEYALSRSVSKVGSFALADDVLNLVAGFLVGPEIDAHYRTVARKSRRDPDEWKSEFSQAFPAFSPPKSKRPRSRRA
jgi:hypothetical protein